MPSNVAAFICGFFIIIVFIIDSKRKPCVSFNHWIPFIWFLILSSRPLGTWLNTTAAIAIEEGDPGSSNIDAIVLTILFLLGIGILLKRIKDCNQILKNNLWLVSLILFCLISISWSDYPAISFKRWFRGFGTFTMALVVLTEIDPLETIRTMFRRCAYLTIPLSILFIKYFRNLGVYYESWGAVGYCGITTGKNPLGRLCFIFCLYFIWEILINWKNKNVKSADIYKSELFINITFFALILWLLIKANSATSLACLVIGICILLFMNFSIVKQSISQLNIIIIFFIFIFIILNYSLNLLTIATNFLGRDPTFTGRTEIWSLCFELVENFLIGVGYDSFWLGNRMQIIGDKLGWYPIQAHNGYIDVYIQTGAIGLFLISAVILSIYSNIKNTLVKDFQLGCFQFSFLVPFLLYNITEDAFKLHSLLWFIFLLIGLRNNYNGNIKKNIN